MPYIPTAGMTHEDWLKARHRTIGSSDVGAILGLSRYKTPLQVWQEKTAAEPPPEVHNKATEWGIRLEDDVADFYAETTGHKVIRDNKIRQHPEYPYLTCNIDRLIIHKDPAVREERGRGILEIKTTVSYTMAAWESEVPIPYYTQVVHQMLVSGFRWGEFAIFILDKRELKIVPFVWDPEFGMRLLTEAVRFCEDFVFTGIEPPMKAQDFELAKTEPEKIVEADNDMLEVCTDYGILQEEIRRLEKKQDELQEKIKEAIGTAEVLASQGEVIATWKATKGRVMFDQKALEKAEPEIYAKYIKVGEPGRMFKFKYKPTR